MKVDGDLHLSHHSSICMLSRLRRSTLFNTTYLTLNCQIKRDAKELQFKPFSSSMSLTLDALFARIISRTHQFYHQRRTHIGATYVLAHDLGTTGNKASLYDERGTVISSSFYAYNTAYPHPNWVEQNPNDWWQAVCVSTHRLLDTAHVLPNEIACIVFSGQMMGCVVIDRNARPLGNAIIWADTRATAEADEMIRSCGMEQAYQITGHRASASYSGAKIMWLRHHQPEIYSQAHKFLHAKDFIVARLTGSFVTDYSDASGMNLYDLTTRNWSPTMLRATGINSEQLPELHASTDVVGEVTRVAAEEVGLATGTPVVIGGGDGSCAAVGAGVIREGSAYNYIGSSSWIGIATRQPIFDPAMRTFNWAHLVPGMITPTGTMQSAGGSYQWLRDVFCLPEKESAVRLNVNPYELMNLQAEQSNPGANGLLFFPYLLGERSPRWNPDARGAYLGLSMSHTRADIVRATLEGITLNLRVILEAFQEQGAAIQAMRVIGGGANGRIWRQIMADVYGIPVQRPLLLSEATSLGAALAGGIGVGIYPDFNLAETLTPIVDTLQPNPALKPLYDQLYALFNKAYDAFVPLYSDLKSIH
jgi:xylulokinase